MTKPKSSMFRLPSIRKPDAGKYSVQYLNYNRCMEERFIVTIGREFGTGGRQIASELAELLGVKLYDRQILDTLKDHYLMSQEQIDYVKSIKPRWWYEPVSADMYRDEEFIVRSLAHKESCVLLGRTGFHIFRDDPRAFKVFLMADRAFRLDKVARRLSISEEEADVLINKVDKARENFTKTFSGNTRYDAHNYDLVLNVTGLEPTAIAQFIAQCVRQKLGL